MRIKIFLKHVLLMSIVLLSTGCGNSGNSGNSGTALMGGAIQGKPLSLSGSVSTLAGTAGNQGSSDGNGAAARFYELGGTTTDGTNIYSADSFNRTIRKIVISTGEVSTLAGTAGVIGSADGIGAAARFDSPIGITTDGTNLYVTDVYTVRKIVISTGAVTTLAGTAGASGSSDGIGAAARFDGLKGITTDGTNLYLPDVSNGTVRKIVISTGAVTTLAGTAGNQGGADGIGAGASFVRLEGITTDGTNLYLTDSAARTIRKVVIASGAVSTLAGVFGSPASIDGIGAAAMFVHPVGITTDGTNLYITDQSIINNTLTPGIMSIRKLVIATGEVTTLVVNNGLNDVAGAFDPPVGIITDGISLFIVNRSGTSINRLH